MKRGSLERGKEADVQQCVTYPGLKFNTNEWGNILEVAQML